MSRSLYITLFIAIFVQVFFAQLEIKQELDTFEDNTATIVLIIPAGGAPPTVEDTAFTVSSNIVGGERDLLLRAESGPENRVLTSGVADGSWSVATPNSASGFANMQYDGTDGNISLNASGLGGVNLLENNGSAFRLTIESDLPTVYTVTVYSGSDTAFCDADATTDGGNVEELIDIAFSDMSSNGCDFSNVGAIEIFVEQFDNVDAVVSLFAIVGEPIPSSPPTPTQTPTPTPTSSPDACTCDCPEFTCAVVYADDDYPDYYYYTNEYLNTYTFVDDDDVGGVVYVYLDDEACEDPFDDIDDDGCLTQGADDDGDGVDDGDDDNGNGCEDYFDNDDDDCYGDLDTADCDDVTDDDYDDCLGNFTYTNGNSSSSDDSSASSITIAVITIVSIAILATIF